MDYVENLSLQQSWKVDKIVKCIKKDYEPYRGITVGKEYFCLYENNYYVWIINNYKERGMYSKRKFEVVK